MGRPQGFAVQPEQIGGLGRIERGREAPRQRVGSERRRCRRRCGDRIDGRRHAATASSCANLASRRSHVVREIRQLLGRRQVRVEPRAFRGERGFQHRLEVLPSVLDQLDHGRLAEQRRQQLLVEERRRCRDAHLGAGQTAGVEERGKHHPGAEGIDADRRAPGEQPLRLAVRLDLGGDAIDPLVEAGAESLVEGREGSHRSASSAMTGPCSVRPTRPSPSCVPPRPPGAWRPRAGRRSSRRGLRRPERSPGGRPPRSRRARGRYPARRSGSSGRRRRTLASGGAPPRAGTGRAGSRPAAPSGPARTRDLPCAATPPRRSPRARRHRRSGRGYRRGPPATPGARGRPVRVGRRLQRASGRSRRTSGWIAPRASRSPSGARSPSPTAISSRGLSPGWAARRSSRPASATRRRRSARMSARSAAAGGIRFTTTRRGSPRSVDARQDRPRHPVRVARGRGHEAAQVRCLHEAVRERPIRMLERVDVRGIHDRQAALQRAVLDEPQAGPAGSRRTRRR